MRTTMRKWAKRTLVALLLLAAIPLVWLGMRPSLRAEPSSIPQQVFGGGPTTVEIKVELTVDCLLSAIFMRKDDDSNDPAKRTRVDEYLKAGTHTRTITMPAGVGAQLDLLALRPKANDQLHLEVRANQNPLYIGTATLHRNLWSGFAQTVVCEDMPIGARPETPACFRISTKFEDFSKKPKSMDVTP